MHLGGFVVGTATGEYVKAQNYHDQTAAGANLQTVGFLAAILFWSSSENLQRILAAVVQMEKIVL